MEPCNANYESLWAAIEALQAVNPKGTEHLVGA